MRSVYVPTEADMALFNQLKTELGKAYQTQFTVHDDGGMLIEVMDGATQYAYQVVVYPGICTDAVSALAQRIREHLA